MIRNKLIAILLAGVFMSSCQLVDVLDHEPPHNMTPESAVKDEKSAELALTGVYGNLIGYYSHFAIGNQAFTSGILRANKSSAVNQIYYSERNLPKLKYSDGFNSPFWNHNTEVINSANLLIAALEGLNDDQFTAGRKVEMEGELRFLRAFSNFEMLRMFGEYDKPGSPYGLILRKKPATVNDVTLARSSVADSYDFILQDLNFAAEHAPIFSKATQASRLAAQALRVKVLFYKGDYATALSEANAFIHAGKRSLVAPYGNIFRDFNNTELIWVRGFAGSGDIDGQATRVKAFHNEGKWGPTDKFLELSENDPRREVIIKNGVGDVFGPQLTINKSANAEGDMPLYFLRYSEIWLIKAECEARTGQGDVLATLNLLRSGHGLPAIDASVGVMEILFREWLMEMSFENGHEWHLIWRYGVDKLIEMNENVKEEFESNQIVDKDAYKRSLEYKRIYAILSAEISANKLVVQNPGYN